MKKWIESDLFETLSKITDLMFFNILFLLLSVPVVTYGAAKTALYEVCLKMADKKATGISDYLNRFRNNLKKQVIPGVIFTVWFSFAVSSSAFCIQMFLNEAGCADLWEKVLLLLSLISIFICCGINEKFYLFSAQFEGEPTQQFINSIRFSLGYPLRSMITAGLSSLPVFLVMTYPQLFIRSVFLFILIYFSAVSLTEIVLMRPVFKALKDSCVGRHS